MRSMTAVGVWTLCVLAAWAAGAAPAQDSPATAPATSPAREPAPGATPAPTEAPSSPAPDQTPTTAPAETPPSNPAAEPAEANAPAPAEANAPAPAETPAAPASEPAAPAEPSSAPAVETPAAEPNKPAIPRSQRPEVIEKQVQYYVDLYSGHLKSGDWMGRAMGVISLARLDDPRATEKLLEVMRKDSEAIMRVYAWEALHGRHTRLTPEQRAEWVKTCWALFDKNMFRGEMRPAVVGVLEEGGPTELGRKRFLRLFETTNCINSTDIRTLYAMGDLLGRWRDPALMKKMIESMSVLNDAYRAEVVLHRLDPQVPEARTMLRESSDFMWSTTQRRWADWLAKSHWKAVEPNQAKAYTALSHIMPNGEPIRDVTDPKWKKDLELRRFRLDQLDVGIALDTTASMGGPLDWVKRDVVKMMRLFDLISREPRIGVTLFRDHGDRYVTKSYPLTDNADALAAALRSEGCTGGGDIPEAALEALDEVVNKQKWSGTKSKKVVILISDAPPQEKTLPQIEALLTETAAKKNFVFYAVKVRASKYVENVLKLPNYDKELTTFDRIAQWGGGKSVWVEFWNQSSSGRWQYASQPLNEDHSPRVIFRDVLKFVLEEGYKDRVDPFVNILIEFIEEPLKEARVAFDKAGPPSPSGPPSDPQMRR